MQSISPPIYERVPENQDETTFDYIRMIVGLPRYKFDSRESLKDEVEKYQRGLLLPRLKTGKRGVEEEIGNSAGMML